MIRGLLASGSLPLCWLLMIVLELGPVAASPASAAPPQVSFDAATEVACRVLPAQDGLSPGEKLVEARFRVSVLIDHESPADGPQVAELLFLCDSPGRRLRVLDFFPKSELTTELAGDVAVDRCQEESHNQDAGLSGNTTLGYGPAQVLLSPSVRLGGGERQTVKETFKRLPPRQLLVAGGTTSGGHGVFFKWKRSTQTTLEGPREFSCVWAVPQDWRADWLTLSCEARAPATAGSQTLAPCGAARFLLAAYLADDTQAYQAASRLGVAQSAWLSAATWPANLSADEFLVLSETDDGAVPPNPASTRWPRWPEWLVRFSGRRPAAASPAAQHRQQRWAELQQAVAHLETMSGIGGLPARP